MRVIEKDSFVRFIPENDEEHDIFARRFTDEYMKTSKIIKTKGFTDEFGEPNGKRYIEIRGATEKKEPKKVVAANVIPTDPSPEAKSA
jgi:hypothetical protein